MGPDLTDEYSKLGPDGMDAVLDTLYFAPMAPLYNNRPLTPTERQNLAAFFQQAAQNRTHHVITAELGLISLAGCLGLFLLNGIVWKKRLRGVRRGLELRARKQRTKTA
jgi:hypothetical protein